MDYGITEKEFWGMTIAELMRMFKSKARQKTLLLQEKAVMDYKLANLIAICVARTQSSSVKIPEMIDYYSFLFEEEFIEAKKQEERNAASEAAFINFAASFNKRFHSEDTAKEVVNE